jgi:hypothetical protein
MLRLQRQLCLHKSTNFSGVRNECKDTFSVPLSQRTDGIFVGRGSLKSSRLVDLKRPAIEEDANVYKFANEIAYIRLGHSEYPGNDDPLVLDLTGNGVNLTGESSAAPMFDMQGTDFAVHTG